MVIISISAGLNPINIAELVPFRLSKGVTKLIKERNDKIDEWLKTLPRYQQNEMEKYGRSW